MEGYGSMRRVYFDHAAAMPVDPRVAETMAPYFTEIWGNPSSLHSFGREAKEALEEARKKVADLIGARKKEEIIFTSGGTESNNLALKGVAYRNREKGNHIITTRIEHISVLNTCKYLEKNGFKVTYLPVDNFGSIDIERLEKEISDKTIIISVMYANGEIGTIQPIKEIGKIAEDNGVYFHVDAVAATGKVPIDVEQEHIDLLSISSNDMRGPKGIGALYVKTGKKLEPIIHGGGQEGGLRSGTENVPNILGMGKAAEIANNEMEEMGKRLTKLRDKLIQGILNNVKYSYLNGHPTHRLPNNVNLRFSYIEGEALILNLDMMGIAASTSSACTSKTLEPSHVLLAIGIPHAEAQGSLLLTLDKSNNEEDVNYVLEILPGIVKRLRTMSPLTPKDLEV